MGLTVTIMFITTEASVGLLPGISIIVLLHELYT